MLYDWQNVGTQEEKVNDDKGQCPACGEKETHLHHTTCLHGKMQEKRCKQFSILSKLLQKQHTYPGLITAIQAIITIGSEKVLNNFPTPASNTDQLVLLQVITSQHHLDNNMCTKGMLSKEWKIIQCQWSQTQHLQHNPRKWTTALIKGIHNFTQAMWTKRNLILTWRYPK